MALISVFLSMVITFYSIVRIFNEVKKELIFLQSVNFQFSGFSEISTYLTIEFLQRFMSKIFSQPVILIGILFFLMTLFYLNFAKNKMKFKGFVWLNLGFFLIGFSILKTFWWVVSIFYFSSKKEVGWR